MCERSVAGKSPDMTLTTMPALGLGTWELEGSDAISSVRTALGLGYTHVDTAQAYGNEAEVGRGIADSGVDRDDVWLTTKVWNTNLAPEAVITSTEESLRRLGTEFVDLLLIHWPAQIDTLEETLEAMTQLQERGLTRHLGVSNFTADQVRRAAKVAQITTNQVEYHAQLGQEPVREALRDVAASLTAYSPLGRGDLLRNDVVLGIAEEAEIEPAQVLLRWLLDQDDVVVVPKATGEAHLRSNLAALSLAPLDPTHTAALDALPKDRRVIDPPFAPDWD